jgi:hypothetical protein
MSTPCAATYNTTSAAAGRCFLCLVSCACALASWWLRLGKPDDDLARDSILLLTAASMPGAITDPATGYRVEIQVDRQRCMPQPAALPMKPRCVARCRGLRFLRFMWRFWWRSRLFPSNTCI